MKTLVTLLVSLLCSSAFAADGLEWQRLELERKIDEHYIRSLSPLLKRDEYQVKSKVKYNDPGMPVFEDLNETDVKVSDIDFDDSKGDYIAFSKVGLEVPVPGKFFKDNQRRLKELYRYNESYDLFKNIESIDVKIVFSDQLDAAKVQAAKKIIETNQFDVAGIASKIEYETAAIRVPDEPLTAAQNDKFGLKEFLELMGQFGNAIGMVLATLLLGLLALFLLKKYMELAKELQQKKDDSDEAKKEQVAEELTDESELDELGLDEEGILTDAGMYGFERFEKFLEFSPEQSVLMLKRWINSRSDEYQLALHGVAQQIDQDKFHAVHDRLNALEREYWLGAIQDLLEPEQLEQANRLISREVVREMVAGSKVSDFELLDVLLNLDMEVAKKFVLNHSKDGGVLINLLTPQMAGRLLDQMDEDQVAHVVKQGLESQVPESEAELKEFKAKLTAFQTQEKVQPFNYKIIQMLPDVTPEKEEILYSFLAGNNRRNDIVAAARHNLPSSLIPKLPGHMMKYVMQNYPMEKKVPLLISVDEQQRDNMIASFAEEGSASRDMIDMELDTIKADELQVQRIKRDSTEIWKNFVGYVRLTLKENADYKQDIENMIKSWAEEICEEAA
jgi:hypothetical protein